MKDDGIVLLAQDYKEKDRIITVFTLNHGLIKLIVKGMERRSPHLFALTGLFCYAEYLYVKGSSDLYRFEDGTVIDSHLELRDQLIYLQIAGEMARAVLQSQMAGKPAPALFTLLISYLKQINSFDNPSILPISFRCKLLVHEGLLSWKHPPAPFSMEEWEALQQVSSIRSFQQLREVKLDQQINSKFQQFLNANVN
jgi:DNA repair protein RecO (recombination protein O)